MQVARQAMVAMVALRWPDVPAARVMVPGAVQALDNPEQVVLDVAAGRVVAAQVRVGHWAWTRGSSYHGHNWHRIWRGQN